MRIVAKNESGYENQQKVREACIAADGKQTASQIAEALATDGIDDAYVRNFWRETIKMIERAPVGSKLAGLKSKVKPLKSGQGRRAVAGVSADDMADELAALV